MPHYEKTEKPLQQRRTFEDVSNYQDWILILIRKKKQNNSCLSIEERNDFIRNYKKAVLSQGSLKCLYKSRKGTIIPFHHLTELAYFLSETYSNNVDIINYETGEVLDSNIPISDLWKFFEMKLIYVFPYACDEASHMSAEAPIREAPTSFEYSAEKKLQ